MYKVTEITTFEVRCVDRNAPREGSNVKVPKGSSEGGLER